MAKVREITFKDVQTFMKTCGYEFEGIWQEDIVKALCKYPNVVVQGPRQITGKTWCVGTKQATNATIGGRRVVLGFPTARQGKRISFEDIEGKVEKFISKMPMRERYLMKRKGPGSKSDILWGNEGRLEALSVNRAAEAGGQGWTCHDLVIDEGHESDLQTHAIFDPFTTKAKLAGVGSNTILGIGGGKNSLIQLKTKDKNYHHIKIMPSDIIAADPSMQKFFDDKKEEYAAKMHLYYQHYECSEVVAGARSLFQNIPEHIEIPDNLKSHPVRHVFGIDIGRESDMTVVTHFEVVDKICNLVHYDAFTGMDFLAQGKRIFEFINEYPYFPGDVVIESNFGIGLCDILRYTERTTSTGRKVKGYIPGLTTYFVTADNKDGLALSLADKIYKGEFAIRDKHARDEVEGIMMHIKENGKTKWDHGDIFSSILSAMNRLMSIEVRAIQ